MKYQKIINLNTVRKQIENAEYIIFDMDETLVNTMYANFMAYNIAINEILAPKKYLSFNYKERFTKQTLLAKFPNLDKSSLEEITQLKNELFKEYLNNTILNSLPIYVLNRYQGRKKLILSTNSNKQRAVETLKYHDLFDKFDYKFYKSEQKDKYQKVISELKIDPSKIVIFEDKQVQIDFAIKSGIKQENIFKLN